MLLERSGLPIEMDDQTFELSFLDGLTCSGGGHRRAGEMVNLFRDPSDINAEELCYYFYRDIVFPEHRELFEKNDFRYDITVIMPGTVNGECKKTSGHYHGYIGDKKDYTYPEVYEVLEGKALYILQKVMNFDQDEEPVFDEIKAVFVEAGQAIVIPPFYGHCSINVGDGPLVFSNIAVVSCPLFYDTMKARRGLSVYALKDENGNVILEKNPNYKNTGDVEICRCAPDPAPAMGIDAPSCTYKAYVQEPQKFEYLLRPEQYVEMMQAMYRPLD